MPSKNRIKDYDVDSYYHIYNRGVNKKKVFKDDEDYAVFLGLMNRYLGDKNQKDTSGRAYDSLGSIIDLVAFCLMPNYFHLFVYQGDDWKAIEQLMRRVTTSYSMYFNRKYKRVGHVFQGSYRGAKVSNDAYLQHITRYIHLKPKDYKQYKWSSYQYYVGKNNALWLKPDRVLGMFTGTDEYIHFVDDLNDYKDTLELVKLYLAE